MYEIKTVLHIQCGQPIFLFCGDARYLYKLTKNEIMSFEGTSVPDEHVAVCNQCGGLLQTKDLALKSDHELDDMYYQKSQRYYYYMAQLQQQLKISPQQMQQYQQQMQLQMDKKIYDALKTNMLKNAYSGRKTDFTIVDDKIKL